MAGVLRGARNDQRPPGGMRRLVGGAVRQAESSEVKITIATTESTGDLRPSTVRSRRVIG